MAEIRLHISEERLDLLTVDEMIAVENVGVGVVSMKAMKGIVAKFVTDDQGAYLPELQALGIIGALQRPEFFKVAKEFFAGVNGLAVNPMKDSS